MPVAVINAIVQVALVLGRAGGGTGGGSSGGGFSGGGGSGGFSSFGGSAGGLGGLGVLMFGGVGAFILFLVVMGIIRAIRGGGTASFDDSDTLPSAMAPEAMGQTFGASETARATSMFELQQGIDEIRAHDPQFDADTLLTGLQASFYVVQQGWCDRDTSMTRSVMADSIWHSHRMQIEGYERSHQHNMLDGLAIQYANLVAASCDGSHDTVVVRFFVKSADYVTDDANGKVVRGHKDLRDWCEDWIYQRSASATTKPGAGLLDRKCPNCGAPLDVELAGTCKYCRAPIMGGDTDWVLVRIDQLPSWEWAMATLPT